jgi:Mg2+/Co2+ transporter CorB
MAFFAGIEMAYYSANRMGLEVKKRKGEASSVLLSKFIDTPASFLGTTLIGFHIFLVFLTLQLSTVMRPVWK